MRAVALVERADDPLGRFRTRLRSEADLARRRSTAPGQRARPRERFTRTEDTADPTVALDLHNLDADPGSRVRGEPRQCLGVRRPAMRSAAPGRVAGVSQAMLACAGAIVDLQHSQ